MWIQSSFCDSGTCLQTQFNRSSFCDTSNCLEAAYKHSTRCASGGSNCVEAAYQGEVLVRDSKLLNGDVYRGPILSFAPTDWEQFIADLPVRG